MGSMMFDFLNNTAWLNASKLIQDKFGKNLSYRTLKVVSANTGSSAQDVYYAKGEDLIIPLKIKNQELGDVIVTRGAYLDNQQKAEVTDLVKFLVQPALYNIQLKKQEMALVEMNKTVSPLSSEKDVVELFNSERFNKQTLSQIILLKSQLELSRNKVALKIHEMTGKNLFVRWNDISSSVNTVEDISTLTDVTIYVENIQSLTFENLSLLESYLSLKDTGHGPLFLIGSTLSMQEIEQQPWPHSLKNDLLGFYFDIDRVPQSQQTSEEILDLLFFKFDSVLS